MSEYNKSRYYWIKLTDSFMSSDAVDFLMSQKDGANYIIIFHALCLKTINNGGVLAVKLGKIVVPYDVEKIQRDCKWFAVDTIRKALDLYKELGLIYEDDNGILAITDFNLLVGSQTVGAAKKAHQRLNKVDNCPQDKDIDIDIPTTTTEVAPTFSQVGRYFCSNMDGDYTSEAEKFHAYNAKRGWDCLPKWEETADLWIARIKKHNKR